jgi:hypothetical protein
MKKALAQLREKTDRELSILAERQLEQTLNLAEEGRYSDAIRSYDVARRLLAVAELSSEQQARMEAQLTRVRAVLDQPAAAVA